MKMNDNTILRIKVPAHLYEAVKAQLTLKEGKQNFGTKDMKPVKGQKAAGAASDKPKAPKKANAPQKATGAMYDKETSKLGAGVSETKKTPKDGHTKLGLEELKAIVELLNGQIAQLEEKKEEKAPVEEEKEKEKVEEAREYDEFERDEEWDEETKSWVPVGSNRYKKLYKPKSHTGTATMTAQQAADATKSSFTKFDPTKDMEESKWGREEYMDEPDYDEKRQRFVKYQPKKTFRPKYVPKGQATMTKGDVGYSSFTKPDADKN